MGRKAADHKGGGPRYWLVPQHGGTDPGHADYIDGYKHDPRIFVWSAMVEHILTKVANEKKRPA